MSQLHGINGAQQPQATGISPSVGKLGLHSVQLGTNPPVRLDAIKGNKIPFAGFRTATKVVNAKTGARENAALALRSLASPDGELDAKALLNAAKSMQTHLNRLGTLGEIRGTMDDAVIAAFAPPLIQVAFKFQPAEYFSLMVLGLVGAIVLANGSLIKAFCMTLLGLLVGLIGTDINSGALRFTFGLEDLQDGLNFVAISMGIFGYAEIMNNLEARQTRNFNTGSVGKVLPSWADIKNCFGPIVRGTAIGSILGVLPGGGALLSSFASYTVEKKIAGKNADPAFGEGNIRGVAGPETANNAGAQTSFIPMLTLGIPSNAVMALMIGAMMIHDIQPGPLVMSSDPGLFWGLIVSMWIGNLMLIILNLPMINIWVKLLKVPYRWLFPAIIAFCVIGTYSINNNVFDIWVSIVFGLLGYLFIKLGCEAAPFILGFILGPMMEENLRRALLLSRGDPSVFVTRPISCGLLIAAAILLILVLAPSIRKKREVAFQDDD